MANGNNGFWDTSNPSQPYWHSGRTCYRGSDNTLYTDPDNPACPGPAPAAQWGSHTTGVPAGNPNYVAKTTIEQRSTPTGGWSGWGASPQREEWITARWEFDAAAGRWELYVYEDKTRNNGSTNQPYGAGGWVGDIYPMWTGSRPNGLRIGHDIFMAEQAGSWGAVIVDYVRVYSWNRYPTGNISGPSTIYWGQSGTFTASGADQDANLTKLQANYSPTGASIDRYNWKPMGTDAACSGGNCSSSFTWNPETAGDTLGTYYVAVRPWDSWNYTCWGNSYDTTDLRNHFLRDLWDVRHPTNWPDGSTFYVWNCGLPPAWGGSTIDYLTVNVACPAMTAPTNLAPDGVVTPEGSRNITWDAVANARYYYLRIHDTTDGTAWDPNNLGPYDKIVDNLQTRSYAYNFQAGHKYDIWVHAGAGGPCGMGPATTVHPVVPWYEAHVINPQGTPVVVPWMEELAEGPVTSGYAYSYGTARNNVSGLTSTWRDASKQYPAGIYANLGSYVLLSPNGRAQRWPAVQPAGH